VRSRRTISGVLDLLLGSVSFFSAVASAPISTCGPAPAPCDQVKGHLLSQKADGKLFVPEGAFDSSQFGRYLPRRRCTSLGSAVLARKRCTANLIGLCPTRPESKDLVFAFHRATPIVK
jgi:hypothetical protein